MLDASERRLRRLAPAARMRVAIVKAGSLLGTLIGLSTVACPSATPLLAQQAIVLSGGGSRGLAHIGVLQHLDSLGYDPGIVIGNSMGAVVGALYAAGYAADEIRARTLAVDWGEMFDATPTVLGPARDVRLPMITFGLDRARGRVGRGLFGEWRINRALVRLLFEADARARGDFDRLARRYRTVAADLETGEKVVLADGDLARAVRASMAVPGFFAPVRWQDRILVDGGIVDNLPTAEARRLGATHVLAVDVSRPSRKLMSQEPLSVVQRALNLMQQNLQPDPVAPDILLAPPADGSFSGGVFPDDPVPLIELGEAEARRGLSMLPPRPDSGSRPVPAVPDTFVALRIEAPDSALAALAREVFAPVAPGTWDPDAILAAVDRLYSTGLFDGVWPHVADGDAGPTLEVRLDVPARTSVSTAAGYDNDRGGRAWAALDRYTPIGRAPGILTFAASTDGLHRWSALSLRLLGPARPAIAWSVGAHVQEHSVRSFTEDTRVTVEVLRAGGWLGIELPHILRERVVTLAARAEWIDPEDAPGGRSFGPLLRVASVPSTVAMVGVPVLLEAEARWGARPYRRIGIAGSLIHDSRAVQMAALVDLRAVSRRAPADVLPALGDQHAIPGMRWGEGRDRARVVSGFDFALPGPGRAFARLRLRTGAVAHEPGAWKDARWVSGAQLGVVWRIPLGSLEVGYGRATTGDGRFDVSLGRAF